jgi:hypothetical protein
MISSVGFANTVPALSVASIDASGEKVVMTDQVYADGRITRRFERGATLLYQSQVKATRDGFSLEVSAGHPTQLGAVLVEKGTLVAKDPHGKPLWTEVLKVPLCLPELTAEFVRAHWDDLKPGAPAVECVVPIIKAKKVAPVKFVRLPDADNGSRRVELLPGSFGMRFFLSPTTLTFSDQSATGNGLDLLLDNVRLNGSLGVSTVPGEGGGLPPVENAIATTPGSGSLGSASLAATITPGEFNISMNATVPGTYVLERSEDLSNWQAVEEKEVTEAGPLDFKDHPNAQTPEQPKPKMFYRIGLKPPGSATSN